MKNLNINLNAAKRKSTRVRESCNELKVVKKVAKCLHKEQIADQDLGYFICKDCHEIVDQIYINDDKDSKVKQAKMLIWERDYDRNRWKNYGIDYLYGNNNDKLTQQLWYEILQIVPEEFTWYDIYKSFQTANVIEYWTAFSSYIKLPVPLSRKVMKMVDKYLNYCNTKYRVTYLYLMYKFVQLYGEEGSEKYIPLARSKAWCTKTDIWWRTVCEKEGFEYKATTIHKLKWNKESILADMLFDLKRRGLEKTILYHENDAVVEDCKIKWLAKCNQLCLNVENGVVRDV